MNNIILIGMPGVGKSTAGVILAKILGYGFIDSDLCIQEKEKCLLRDIIEEKGVDGFIKVENDVLKELNAEKAVIATGGSAVYGEEAMAHLKSIGTVVYLELPYSRIKKRLSNIKGRGVVVRDGQTLKDLFEERRVLYERYADVTIHEAGMSVEETVAEIRKYISC